MGLLKMLFEKKKAEFTERFCLTTECKLAALVREVGSDRKCGVNAIVVTHFPATQRLLIEAFKKDGQNVHSFASHAEFPTNILQAFREQDATLVLAAEAIPAPGTETGSAQARDMAVGSVTVYLAEHYPCTGRDERVLALERLWPVRLQFTCYTSLDEPWLKSPGIARIRGLLTKLGMDQETVMEPARNEGAMQVLRRSFQAEQKRLAQLVPHEKTCESCEEWVRINLGGSFDH